MKNITDDIIRGYAEIYVDYDYPWEPVEIEIDIREGYKRGEDPLLSRLDPADLDSFIQDVIKENDKLMKGYFDAH